MFKAFVTVSTPEADLLAPEVSVALYKVVRDQFRVYANDARLGDFHGDPGIWVEAKALADFHQSFVAAVEAAKFHGGLRLTAVCADQASLDALEDVHWLAKTR